MRPGEVACRGGLRVAARIGASLLAGWSLAGAMQAQAEGRVPDGLEILPETLRFSPDGTRVAYVVLEEGRQQPVVDHSVWKGKGYGLVEPPVFDPSGEHVFFRVAELDRRGELTWRLLRDGKKVNEGGWIGPVAVNPEGAPVYWVFEDARQVGGCVLYFGKKKSSKWGTGDTDDPPVLLDGGRLAASVATRGGNWSVVTLSEKGKKEAREHRGVYTLVPAPGTDEVLLTVIKNQNRRRIDPVYFHLKRYSLEEKEVLETIGSAHRSVGSPVYSPGGGRLAFRVLGDDWMGVATDEQRTLEPTQWKFVDELSFSPDGEHLAYAACVVGDLEYERPTSMPMKSAAVLPGASATSGRWTVVLDDVPRETYEHVRRLTWSPDGSRLAFTALSDGAWRVVVDDRSSEPADEIAEIRWDGSSKRLRYGALEGREILWRELELD